MTLFQRVLLLGTGPAALQLALHFKRHCSSRIGIAGRRSARSASFFSAMERNDRRIQATVQNEKHGSMAGECQIDELFHGYEEAKGDWDTLVLAVTTDAYIDVLKQLDERLLRNIKRVVLLSPTLGSNSLVRHYLRAIQPACEVISFSTYLGDTRWAEGKPASGILTTAVKRKLYIGSTHSPSQAVEALGKLCAVLGIALEVLDAPIEAETRNISLYVHPPLFMNDFSLRAVFDESSSTKYVYKLFPEGPITQRLIGEMLTYWREVMLILKQLRIKPLNLLQFMTADNYPVREESLSPQDIERFPELDAIHQQYLLYVRYASLLIDPFSQPDEEGRYFDFSAVPIRTVFLNREQELDIPRMPKEDYYRLKVIQGIAHYWGVNCPAIDTFVQRYEHKIREAAKRHRDKRLSDGFAVRSFQEHIEMICSELDNGGYAVQSSSITT